MLRRAGARSCACTRTGTAMFGPASGAAASACGAARSVAWHASRCSAASHLCGKLLSLILSGWRFCRCYLLLGAIIASSPLHASQHGTCWASCRVIAADGCGHAYIGSQAGDLMAVRLRFTRTCGAATLELAHSLLLQGNGGRQPHSQCSMTAYTCCRLLHTRGTVDSPGPTTDSVCCCVQVPGPGSWLQRTRAQSRR